MMHYFCVIWTLHAKEHLITQYIYISHLITRYCSDITTCFMSSFLFLLAGSQSMGAVARTTEVCQQEKQRPRW